MRSMVIAMAFSCTAAHAETDFYDVVCTADQAGASELRFAVSIASGNATIGGASATPVEVAMYENAFVWVVGGVEFTLDRFSGRLTESVRGADGKRMPVGPTSQCSKIGGKTI